MTFDWKMILFIWLILGIASSMLVYWDMDRRNKVQSIWALLCIPLSVAGIYMYLAVRGKIANTGRELPPKPDYGKPEYVFKEEPKVEKTPEPVVEMKVEDPAPEPEPVKEIAPEPPKEEVVLPEPPPVQAKAEWKEEKPVKREPIEGIPRCPRCNAAVSSFDESCRDCGTKLK